MSDLEDAAEDLMTWLIVGEHLIAQPDKRPALRSSGKPGSKPPWNAAVAHAILDAHQGVRDLEQRWSDQVTGRHRDRGGSNGNTAHALKRITSMELAVTRDDVKEGTRLLRRWATTIRQLPAIDDAPRWEKIRAGPDGLPPKCLFCGTFSLRVAIESGVVICVYPDCKDSDGNRPQALLEVNKLDGSPVLVWASGEAQ